MVPGLYISGVLKMDLRSRRGLRAAVPTGEEQVGGTGNGLLRALVKGIVVVLGVCREARLMAQDIAQGQFCLPLLVDLQARVLVAVVGNVDGVLHKALPSRSTRRLSKLALPCVTRYCNA